MEARKLTTAQEALEAAKISTIAFVGSMDPEKAAAQAEKELRETEGSEEFWGAFDENGVMTSHMINNIYHILFDGHIVLCGGVGNVSSLPEYRRKGGIRAIFAKKFADMRKRGFVFSALYPFSHEYYRKFGYELCYCPMRQTVRTADLAGYDCPYEVRMHKEGECIQPFKDVYQRFILGKNMAIVRSERQWDWIAGDPYKEKVYRYLLSDETGAHAYIVFKPEGDGDGRKAVVRDLAYDSREALYGLLGFLYRLGAQYAFISGVFPDEIDFRTLVTEPYHVAQEVVFHGMFRVVDVERALALMHHPQGCGRYVLKTADAFLPENDGTYAVEYENGAAVLVQRTEEAPDLEVDVTTLAQLMMGYADLKTLAIRKDVTIHGNRETLSAVFTRKERYFSDYF